jgi:hypothetical protein
MWSNSHFVRLEALLEHLRSAVSETAPDANPVLLLSSSNSFSSEEDAQHTGGDGMVDGMRDEYGAITARSEAVAAPIDDADDANSDPQWPPQWPPASSLTPSEHTGVEGIHMRNEYGAMAARSEAVAAPIEDADDANGDPQEPPSLIWTPSFVSFVSETLIDEYQPNEPMIEEGDNEDDDADENRALNEIPQLLQSLSFQ